MKKIPCAFESQIIERERWIKRLLLLPDSPFSSTDSSPSSERIVSSLLEDPTPFPWFLTQSRSGLCRSEMCSDSIREEQKGDQLHADKEEFEEYLQLTLRSTCTLAGQRCRLSFWRGLSPIRPPKIVCETNKNPTWVRIVPKKGERTKRRAQAIRGTVSSIFTEEEARVRLMQNPTCKGIPSLSDPTSRLW